MRKTSVETFRSKLQNILDHVEGDDNYHKGVRAVVKALLSDYDTLFPKVVWGSDSLVVIVRLIEKHCNPDKWSCPICGSPLSLKSTKAGSAFRGCQKYPLCRGSRSHAGNATINDAMKEFLSQKIEEERKHHNSRFRNLDL